MGIRVLMGIGEAGADAERLNQLWYRLRALAVRVDEVARCWPRDLLP